MGPWTTTSCSTSATGMRLERFGERIVARPHPGAEGPRRDPGAWRRATLTFESERGWTGPDAADPWPVDVAGLTVELRPTATGQVGLFPEQAPNWAWLREVVAGADDAPTVLNLFGYTGVATLIAVRSRCLRRPRGCRPADRRVGSSQCGAVRASRPADPLDRRRRRGLRRARGSPRAPLRRDRARPAELRPRPAGSWVAARGRPRSPAPPGCRAGHLPRGSSC